jgi:hypothetical protein
VPLVYHARLLTAKPVREALLRLISLGITGATVDAKDFDPEGKTQKEQERVEEFVKLNPNDLRVRGNGLYIIIGVTLKEAYWGWTKEESYQSDPISQPHYDPKAGPYLFYRERVKGDELSNVDLSKIYADTSLSVSAGRRVDLVRYNPPDADRLGAKFFFPRNLPDGTSFIRTDDKELWFKTRLNGVNVRVKFNLDKMSYKGRVET